MAINSYYIIGCYSIIGYCGYSINGYFINDY
jgi:hypothetical protein